MRDNVIQSNKTTDFDIESVIFFCLKGHYFKGFSLFGEIKRPQREFSHCSLARTAGMIEKFMILMYNSAKQLDKSEFSCKR